MIDAFLSSTAGIMANRQHHGLGRGALEGGTGFDGFSVAGFNQVQQGRFITLRGFSCNKSKCHIIRHTPEPLSHPPPPPLPYHVARHPSCPLGVSNACPFAEMQFAYIKRKRKKIPLYNLRSLHFAMQFPLFPENLFLFQANPLTGLISAFSTIFRLRTFPHLFMPTISVKSN
jgi:hypothetical protein